MPALLTDKKKKFAAPQEGAPRERGADAPR